jgi:hypothetical protein
VVYYYLIDSVLYSRGSFIIMYITCIIYLKQFSIGIAPVVLKIFYNTTICVPFRERVAEAYQKMFRDSDILAKLLAVVITC